MLKDFHIHTHLCKHADGEIREYIEKAIEAGLVEIGFADHIPFPEGKENSVRMEPEELPLYLGAIEEARESYKDISVKIGLEAEYLPGSEKFLKEIIASYDFDFILGSIHYISDWKLEKPSLVHYFNQEEVNKYYREYYDLISEAALSGLFTGISHLDLVNQAGYDVENGYYYAAENALKVIKKADIALEINTSGFRRERKEFFPSPPLLKKAIELEIPLFLGSDAHSPDEVGKDFDKATNFLKTNNVFSLYSFSKKKRKKYKM